MISAAIVTYSLRNKSIDHVRRTYLKDIRYEEDPGAESRLDRGYKRACFSRLTAIQAAINSYPPLLGREPTVGEWIGDLTLIRADYSFRRAFAEADKGALFEAVAIARMILEQLAWVYVIRGIDDAEKVQKTQTTKCMGITAAKFRTVGRLYGWMSDHVHWGYNAHAKVITSNDDGYSGAWLATPQFKATAYAMLIALTAIAYELVIALLGNYPELIESKVLKDWLVESDDFSPVSMVERIYELSDESEDINTILEIVKVATNDG